MTESAPTLIGVRNLRKHFALGGGLLGCRVEMVRAVEDVSYRRAYELTFVIQGWLQSERIRPGSATRRLQAVQQASTMAR